MIPNWQRFTGIFAGILTGFLIPLSLWLTLTVVPSEAVMGAVQRIFYLHVGSAIAAYLAFGICFITGIRYLIKRDPYDDSLNEASGEVGFVLCSIVLASGMIWGHSAWNTWFRWEPRLVTFLLLWLIFLTFVILRSFGQQGYEQNTQMGAVFRVNESNSVQASILSIIGSATVPLVWLSVKLLPQSAQLHPQVIEQQGLRHPLYNITLVISIISLVSLMFWLIFFRSRIAFIERKIASSYDPSNDL
jgi:heme exporter protein C